MKQYQISSLILLFLLLTLACNAGRFSPAGPAAATPTAVLSPTPTKSNPAAVVVAGAVQGLPTPIVTIIVQPTATPSLTPAISTTTALASLNQSLAALDSYRLQLTFTFDGTTDNGAAVSQAIDGEMVVAREPAATSIDATLSGLAGLPGVQTFTFVQTGDQVYLILPGATCLNGPADEMGLGENPLAAITSPAAFLGNLDSVRLAGMGEVVNGVTTTHFIFDQTALPDTAGTFQSLDGHLYLAQDGHYPVRLVLDGNGVLNLGRLGGAQQGITHLQLDILDANEPMSINPPAGC